MNDSVDLLTQNLKRFKGAGLAPGPRSLSELLQSSDDQKPQELVVFCKKNYRDLDNLIGRLKGQAKIVVIDDEADYATPNAKINQGAKTKINELVGTLIGDTGLLHWCDSYARTTQPQQHPGKRYGEMGPVPVAS